MCGIIVSSGGLVGLEKLEEGHRVTSKRGPDTSNVVTVNNNVFMFNRLSIMGLSINGMQPFSYKGNTLVANAEIYNYKQIKDELKSIHNFKSESDCEVLLPLYNEIGTNMFKYLDAEFAIVLYDEKLNKLIAARDPLGIRPLFYGYIKNTLDIRITEALKGAQIGTLPMIVDGVLHKVGSELRASEELVTVNAILIDKCPLDINSHERYRVLELPTSEVMMYLQDLEAQEKRKQIEYAEKAELVQEKPVLIEVKEPAKQAEVFATKAKATRIEFVISKTIPAWSSAELLEMELQKQGYNILQVTTKEVN